MKKRIVQMKKKIVQMIIKIVQMNMKIVQMKKIVQIPCKTRDIKLTSNRHLFRVQLHHFDVTKRHQIDIKN